MKRIFGTLVFIVSMIYTDTIGVNVSFFVDDVYAEWNNPAVWSENTNTSSDNASTTELTIVIWLETIVRVIYLIMRPLLAIAGAAMDNSLVYGKIFNFTPALWKFWTMMRTFANFALWWLFLWAMFKTIFMNGSTSDLFDALKKLVLWAILVQVSRFAVSILIDFSTVATVSLGWLPLYAVKDDSDYNKISFLKPYGVFQLDQTANTLTTTAEHTVFYGCAGDPSQFYIPCSINAGKLATKWAIMDPESRENWKSQFINSRKNIPLWIDWFLPATKNAYLSEETINNDFCVYGNSLITNTGGALLSQENIIKFREAGVKQMQDTKCMTLDSMIQKSKWMSGPLFTLYASILNTSEIALTTNHKNIADLSLEFLMRVVMSLLLAIPLLVFAVIMIMRVAYLWLIIATSPILVLLFVNKKEDSVWWWEAVKELVNLKNILNLIFLPVIGTFAISLSVVFLSLIQRANFMRPVTIAELFDLDSPTTATTNDPNVLKKCYDLKVTKLCFNESQRNAGNNILDTFSYLLINGFGLALMWTVVFAALKSSAITAKVVDSVQKLWQTALSSIPIPGSWGLSFSWAKALGWKLAQIPNRMVEQQNKELQNEINRVDNSSSFDAVKKDLSEVASWTQENAKQTILNTSIKGSGYTHEKATWFFDALNKWWGTTNPAYSNFRDAFADETNYKSYGMQGMEKILDNWNGTTWNESKRYLAEHGKQMIDALDALSSKASSGVKKIIQKSTWKIYYYDLQQWSYSVFDPKDKEFVFTANNFKPELSSANFALQDKNHVEDFLNQWKVLGENKDAFDLLSQVYPKTTYKIKESQDPRMQIAEDTTMLSVDRDGWSIIWLRLAK